MHVLVEFIIVALNVADFATKQVLPHHTLRWNLNGADVNNLAITKQWMNEEIINKFHCQHNKNDIELQLSFQKSDENYSDHSEFIPIINFDSIECDLFQWLNTIQINGSAIECINSNNNNNDYKINPCHKSHMHSNNRKLQNNPVSKNYLQYVLKTKEQTKVKHYNGVIDPPSHAIKILDKYRAADGEASLVTELNHVPSTFKLPTNYDINLHSIINEGDVTMTGDMRRLLSNDNETNTTFLSDINNSNSGAASSYLSSMYMGSFVLTFGVLPWWISIILLVVAVCSIILLLRWIRSKTNNNNFVPLRNVVID